MQHDGVKARLLLETQNDGKAIDIFESKYPESQGLFIFDNAPSHKKYCDDSLNADKMNVRPGGKQPVMRDTMFEGKVQRMVLPDGTPKGMKMVLEERNIDTKDMVAAKMKKELNKFDDFKNKKSILEERVELRGHICLYLPKFHCELNPIERCWCQAKKHTRGYANGTITSLRKIVPEGLDSVKSKTIKKFFITCKDYLKA